jgi:hypothetical protein
MAGALTLRGQSGDPLVLNSSNPGTFWTINQLGSVSAQYLDVTDSESIGGTLYSPYSTFTGCSGWALAPPPEPVVVPDPPELPGPSAGIIGVNEGVAGPEIDIGEEVQDIVNMDAISGGESGQDDIIEKDGDGDSKKKGSRENT